MMGLYPTINIILREGSGHNGSAWTSKEDENKGGGFNVPERNVGICFLAGILPDCHMGRCILFICRAILIESIRGEKYHAYS
jgi:hypothetical protein